MFAPLFALVSGLLQLIMQSGIFLQKLVDDCIVLFVADFLSFGLYGAADLFFKDGDILELFLDFLFPALF